MDLSIENYFANFLKEKASFHRTYYVGFTVSFVIVSITIIYCFFFQIINPPFWFDYYVDDFGGRILFLYYSLYAILIASPFLGLRAFRKMNEIEFVLNYAKPNDYFSYQSSLIFNIRIKEKKYLTGYKFGLWIFITMLFLGIVVVFFTDRNLVEPIQIFILKHSIISVEFMYLYILTKRRVEFFGLLRKRYDQKIRFYSFQDSRTIHYHFVELKYLRKLDVKGKIGHCDPLSPI